MSPTTDPATSAPDPVAKDGLVLFALAMGGFAIGTTEFATMSLMPYMARGLGVDAPTAGHVISAYALGVVFGAPVLAVLGARLARRTLLLVLKVMFVIGNGLSAFAPTYHWMLVFRFISGLPHGAYFGVASLVAASVVAENRRTLAVSRLMLGLTIATIIGVPAADWLGQAVGWRWGFAIVTGLGLLTLLLIALFAPRDRALPDASPLGELAALRVGQVWLTLAIGAVGFGGMFAVYTYLASTLLDVTHATPTLVPVFFAVFGLGMTAGTLAAPIAADRALMPTAGGLLLWSAVMLALYPLAAPHPWLMGLDVFMIGTGVALGTVLQIRLMDVAGRAQALAAALNHSAFNSANALGPLLGGLAIAAGYGWTSTGLVGCALALGGFAIWLISMRSDRRPRRLATMR